MFGYSQTNKWKYASYCKDSFVTRWSYAWQSDTLQWSIMGAKKAGSGQVGLGLASLWKITQVEDGGCISSPSFLVPGHGVVMVRTVVWGLESWGKTWDTGMGRWRIWACWILLENSQVWARITGKKLWLQRIGDGLERQWCGEVGMLQVQSQIIVGHPQPP